MSLEAIKYTRGSLRILNQLKLPHDSVYLDIRTSEDGYFAILNMIVRGAPAIAIVAALSLAVELHNKKDTASKCTVREIRERIENSLDYLNASRPTAVNLSDAVSKLKTVVEVEAIREGSTAKSVVEAYTVRAENMLQGDVTDNRNIGEFGAEWLMKAIAKEKISVLTHCNTG